MVLSFPLDTVFVYYCVSKNFPWEAFCSLLLFLSMFCFHLSKEWCSCRFCSWDFMFAPGVLVNVLETWGLPLCAQRSACSCISRLIQDILQTSQLCVLGQLNGLGLDHVARCFLLVAPAASAKWKLLLSYWVIRSRLCFPEVSPCGRAASSPRVSTLNSASVLMKACVWLLLASRRVCLLHSFLPILPLLFLVCFSSVLYIQLYC